ncbi:hypothetical protein [Streptomyces sp. N2A]|uniref:hypothetical protein n=1 Tax=Streptomyces sp. N2A TaxID=3073936 RepID=UPI0028702548|nr:hypothetical protein [Streptomyces sp. N2A]
MPHLGGVRPPIAAITVLLLAVPGITAMTVGRSSDSTVSQAVVESQQLMAADAAGSLSSSLDQSSHHLRDATALLGLGAAHSPDSALRRLSHSHGKWRGLAAVDPASGRLLAARGENVPLNRLSQRGSADALQPRLVTLGSGQPRLLSFALLDAAGGKRQLLIASGSLRLPEQKEGRTTFVQPVRAGQERRRRQPHRAPRQRPPRRRRLRAGARGPGRPGLRTDPGHQHPRP